MTSISPSVRLTQDMRRPTVSTPASGGIDEAIFFRRKNPRRQYRLRGIGQHEAGGHRFVETPIQDLSRESLFAFVAVRGRDMRRYCVWLAHEQDTDFGERAARFVFSNLARAARQKSAIKPESGRRG